MRTCLQDGWIDVSQDATRSWAASVSRSWENNYIYRTGVIVFSMK
jgi:hypothetical protein